jgi:hypothetical protein
MKDLSRRWSNCGLKTSELGSDDMEGILGLVLFFPTVYSTHIEEAQIVSYGRNTKAVSAGPNLDYYLHLVLQYLFTKLCSIQIAPEFT